jgi:type I restriction enzyme S subunit
VTGLKQHPEYKASGVDWLGDIPAHWEMVKLKNGFDLQKRPAIKSAGIVTAFRDGQVTLRSNRRIDGYTEGDKQIGYQNIHPGDLVIHAMDAFAGAIGVSDSLGQSTPVYSACTPKSGFNAHFYARALRHIALTGYISSLAKGVRERSTDFRWADAKELPIPRPPLEEQNNIVSFLDRETAQIDNLIGKQERLIKLLAEKRQAVITHAVTKGLDPTAPTKPTGIPWLGDVPADWTIFPFRLAVDYQEGPGIMASDFMDDGVPLLRISGVKGSYASIFGCKYLDPSKVESRWGHFRLRSGDILISASASTGTVSEVDEETVGSVAYTGIIRLRPNERTTKEFLKLLVVSGPFLTQIDLLKTGSTMQHYGPSHLDQMKFSFPPLTEQRKIVNHVNGACGKIDMLVEKVQASIGLLQERRSALISAAVTGKIDVKKRAA